MARPLPGFVVRAVAAILVVLFALIVLLAVVRFIPVFRGDENAANPISILLGSGIWLAILMGLIKFLWRVGNHFLSPATHGFGLREQQRAVAILKLHEELDLSALPEADSMYASLSLRELLQTYSLMDIDSNPERLKALLSSIRLHVDPAQSDS